MDSNPSRPADVAVVLTPTQAKRIADAIRIELASQWDTAWFTSLPCREDVGKARSLLDVYSDQLEELEWGEAARNVELHSRRDRLEYLEVILTEGAAECLADSDSSHNGARRAKMQGQDMIAAADAIHQALHQHARSATA